MKKLKTLALSALFAFSSVAFAQTAPNTAQTAPTVETVQPSANLHTVNINTASAAELQDKLTGIGAKKAQAIVTYRETHGAFTSVDQLSAVSGIGAALIKQNRERIVLE